MLKNSKFYRFFSKFFPITIGFGIGAGFSFLINLIPKVRDLNTAYIVLITLGIVLVSMILCQYVFGHLIPKHDTKKKFEQYRNSLIDQMIGLIDGDQTKEEIKQKLKDAEEAYKRGRADFEKQIATAKSSKKNQKGAETFGTSTDKEKN